MFLAFFVAVVLPFHMRRFRPMMLVRESSFRAPASLDGYLLNKNARAPALTSASDTQPRITTQRYAISAASPCSTRTICFELQSL